MSGDPTSTGTLPSGEPLLTEPVSTGTEPPTAEPSAGGSPPSGRRPNPQLDQWKRTWYFLRKNTLALFGLGVIVLFVLLAFYAATTPISWDQLPECFGTNNQVVSFQESGLPTGTSWSVTIDAVTVSSITPYVNFSLQNGPSYDYTVGSVSGYSASPSSGSFQLAGTPRNISIAFSAGGAAAPASASHPSLTPSSAGAPLSCVVCTYPSGTPSPGPGCYATPPTSPSVIGPTFTLAPLALGSLPLGALTQSPSTSYFFNLYDAMLRGIDYTLMLSVGIVAIGAVIGLFIGAVAGFWGGVVDEALMRFADIFLSIPQILFVIVVVVVVTTDVQTIANLGVIGTRLLLLILGFAVVWWPLYSRIVRSQVLVVREQKYVEAARASGASRGRIIRKHVIPNSLYPVFIQMSLDVGTIPLLVGFLVFLGFQIWPVPNNAFPEWGTISALGTLDVITQFLGACETGLCSIPWWQLFFPGVAIFLFAISVNFLSDGLRDALDPRLRR